MLRVPAAPGRLLLWCLAGAALAQLVLARIGSGNPDRFSPIFWFLLKTYDTHGNVVVLAVAACAFALRRQPLAAAALGPLAERPWAVAAAAFPLFCLGAVWIYHDYPLSMDEYSALFQAQVFAAGRLSGAFPPELVERLIPAVFQGYFFGVSPATGAVSSTYWPGFALLMAPFAWLGAPWAANPALGALTIPVLHRLARELTEGSRDAAGWAVALTLASPVFVLASISYYSLAAHMFFNMLYALLLLRPSVPRALAAGAVGSLALSLHNPVPHLLFSLAFLVWVALRPGRAANLAALLLGYLPLGALLGVGWHSHLAGLASAAGGTVPLHSVAPLVVDTVFAQLAAFLKLPSPATVHARIAGLSKVWTWGAAGLMVLAAYGYKVAREAPGVRVLGAALLVTFFGYFLVPFDQGHGWGYRYVHPAWFVLPLLAGLFLGRNPGEEGRELRAMAAWAVFLSFAFAVGLRLVQVETFIDRHRAQVPPLLQPVEPGRREIVFVDTRAGFYTRDMVQNDPLLRAPRIVMVRESRESAAQLMAKRYPEFTRTAQGDWGEQWTATQAGRRGK
jgi:hypothetical protein